MNVFHAFLFENEAEISENEVFEKIKSWFSGSPRNSFLIDSNPFTGANILKLTTDEKYVTSFQYERGKTVAVDYSEVSDSETIPSARVRVLMGPDENSEFDDIAVMVLQLLANFTKSPIYNVSTKQFIT
jgi:hypothetical protein